MAWAEIEVYANVPATASSVQWLVSDQLGTPRMILDKTGLLSGVKRHDYFPFGEEVPGDSLGRTSARGYASDTVRQKFTGYERDNETGLDYAQARYFANAQGRFTSPDPLLASGQTQLPQSWNRYSYTINNPLKYVDPAGLIWGSYTGNADGKTYYKWYEDEKTLKASGATIVEENCANGFMYQIEGGTWIRLSMDSNNWDSFGNYFNAFYNTHGPVGLVGADPKAQAAEFTFSWLGGKALGAIGGKLLGFFSPGAGEAAGAAATAAGEAAGTTESAGTGLSMEGLAFERKFLFKHLEGTAEAAREASRGGAHVFNDLSTLSRVESEIFTRGTFTGNARGFGRWGLQFNEPIGSRIATDGTRTVLNYGEMKLRSNGLYHVIPRTGPSQ